VGEAQLAGGQAPVTAEVTARRFVLASPVTATGLLVLVLATAADLTLAGLVHQLTPKHILLGSTLVLAFGGVGVVVARRQPHNPIGWILLGLVVLLALGGVAGFYAVLSYRLGHRGLPFGPVAVVLSNTVWLPALALSPLIILLFPDGRLPGPLAGVVHQALEPAHVSVWIREGAA
jgi:hypothetical protein